MYDKAGHIVPFDTDLIEKNKEIFFSGYLKHLTCEGIKTFCIFFATCPTSAETGALEPAHQMSAKFGYELN